MGYIPHEAILQVHVPAAAELQDFWCVMYKRYLEKYNADGFYFDGACAAGALL